MKHHHKWYPLNRSTRLMWGWCWCWCNRLNLAESIKFGLPPGDAASRNNSSTINAAIASEGGSGAAQEPYSPYPLTTTVLVLGPLGSGKSATINAILGAQACDTSATTACTKKVCR